MYFRSYRIFLCSRWKVPESRVHHYGNVIDVGPGNHGNPEFDVIPMQRIKTHPFFIMRYGLHSHNPKLQSEQQKQKQKQGCGSTSSQQSAIPGWGFKSRLSDVPE